MWAFHFINCGSSFYFFVLTRPSKNQLNYEFKNPQAVSQNLLTSQFLASQPFAAVFTPIVYTFKGELTGWFVWFDLVCFVFLHFMQISDWWVQWAYLECRQPLAVHSNPAISLPKRDFTDWRGQLVYVTARIYTHTHTHSLTHSNKHPYRTI